MPAPTMMTSWQRPDGARLAATAMRGVAAHKGLEVCRSLVLVAWIDEVFAMRVDKERPARQPVPGRAAHARIKLQTVGGTRCLHAR